ncbi:conserved Plasmodium protein, unknown function [Plasmodium gallinaceum]|uniref:Protein kinase domain-containing protein n=1 Tax=Plasmodium gallinaceum TaxID=5849 RepID=A0A1J1GXQ9_PLAGA|nr:conserved Plasmodium protein, unknown function [Plasmodium gallinaceum]CRG95792.1 conserved Plasmodium protein, unknown function [Plasmodium gallinaceum]
MVLKKSKNNSNNNINNTSEIKKNSALVDSLNAKNKKKKRKYHEKLPDFSCLKKLIYEQKKKDNSYNLFSFNDPYIKEKIDKFNKIIENRQEYSNIETNEEDEITKNFCETSTFGYTFIDKVSNFANKEDIEDLIQHDEEDEEEENEEFNENEKREKNKKREECNKGVERNKEGNIFNKKGIIDLKKKDMILDQLKLKFDEFKIDTLTIPQKPVNFIDENGKEKKKLFIFNINSNNNKKKNEKKRIQIIYDEQKTEDKEDIVTLVNKINDQKESYLYFAVKDNELLLNRNNDYFSIMMHYLCEKSSNINIQMLYYLIMKPPNMDMLLYLILTYYKFNFLDILEHYENICINNIIESTFEEISLYDYYYYFFHILEISHEHYYMSIELFNGMKFLLDKYNFFLGRMHKNSIFSKTKFVLGMGDIQNIKNIFLNTHNKNSKIENQKVQENFKNNEDSTTDGSENENKKDPIVNKNNEDEKNIINRKNGALQYILNTKLDFINYQQKNFFNETHWDEIENYYHLNNLDKLVYFTKDLYYKFTKKNIYMKLNEITCEQKHFDKIQIIEYCKKKIPFYKKNVKFMNFLGVYSHSFIWQIYCLELELFCVLKFKRINSEFISHKEKFEEDKEKEKENEKINEKHLENFNKNIIKTNNDFSRYDDNFPILKENSDFINDEGIIKMLYKNEKVKNELNERKRENFYNLKDIEDEINNALIVFKNYVKEKNIQNLFFPISVEMDKNLVEKTKYINGTPLNEFIYSEFLSGIDLKLRVFKLKCIILKIIKIILTFLNFDFLIILKCSRLFLKEDNLLINAGMPLGLLSNNTLCFLLNNIDETIATKTYSKTIFYYLPPEIINKLNTLNNENVKENNKKDMNYNPYEKKFDNNNCFLFDDKIKLQKAYSYMIGKIFEETLIDTFTGDKFDYFNFDENVKDFLLCCLEGDPEQREPLENLLNHKCFFDCFDLYINIYDDKINSYKNDKEKAIRLRDLNYINNFDYNNIFSIPSEHSSRPPSFSHSKSITESSQLSTSNT